ncbi:MAG: hypothetical protein ACYCW6_17585 [Candidatus Xenobia bacterium]
MITSLTQATPRPNVVRRAIEGTAGLVGGVAGSILHAPAGALDGLAEGLTSPRGEPGTALYHLATFASFVGAGAGLGAVIGGPAGAIIGGAIGLVSEGLNALIESRAEVPSKFVGAVQAKVDPAIAGNTSGSKIKIAVQNATQGVILGTGEGFRGGWSIGWDSGSAVAGVGIDLVSGLLQGIVGAFRKQH